MPIRPDLRQGLLALALSVMIASCASEAPPVVVVAPPPPPPTTIFATRIIEQAAAYRRYMDRAIAITPAFVDGPAVADALRTGAAYSPLQLQRGAIAYAAVVALQDPAFVAGVRTFAKDPEQRRQIAYEVIKDPRYVIGIPGAASAAALVMSTLGGEGQRLYDEGKAVKQGAYDLQRQPWSKGDVADPVGRLALVKAMSAAEMVADLAETNLLQQAVIGAAPLSLTATPVGLTGVPSPQPVYTTTVTRGLAIAALGILGEAGEANLTTVAALMLEPNIGSCMTLSKLNLNQCLAVARPHYEDVFCLGQHAMMDTGRCLIRASGLAEPYEARFVPDASSIARQMKPAKPPAKKRPTKR